MIIHTHGLKDSSKLSPHFKVKEFKVSSEYPNLIKEYKFNELQMYKLKTISNLILEPLREEMETPIHITSGFRTIELNKKIGGSTKSQHLLCEAVDFTLLDDNINYDEDGNSYHYTGLLWDAFEFITENLQNSYLKVILYKDINEMDEFVHISIPSLDVAHQKRTMIAWKKSNGKREFETYTS